MVFAQVVNEYIKKERPQDRSPLNTRRHNKRQRNTFRDKNLGLSVG
jgi:hypothetical protein